MGGVCRHRRGGFGDPAYGAVARWGTAGYRGGDSWTNPPGMLANGGATDEQTAWIDMLGDRNAMSHEYDLEAFEAVAEKVHRRYPGLFEELVMMLAREREQA